MTTPHWKCPSCGSTNLSVNVSVWADLHQTDDNFETTDSNQMSHEWDGRSPMVCNECGHTEKSGGFKEPHKR